MKLEFSRHIFEQFSNIKFYENPSSERRVFSCGQSDRRTDLTKLTAAFHSVANAQTTISTRQTCPLTKFENSVTCTLLYLILNKLNAAYKFIYHSLKSSLILYFFLNQGSPSGRILLSFQTVIFHIYFFLHRFACSSHLALTNVIILCYLQKISNNVPLLQRTGITAVKEIPVVSVYETRNHVDS
jgi:hypothetical protein